MATDSIGAYEEDVDAAAAAQNESLSGRQQRGFGDAPGGSDRELIGAAQALAAAMEAQTAEAPTEPLAQQTNAQNQSRQEEGWLLGHHAPLQGCDATKAAGRDWHPCPRADHRDAATKP